MVNPNRPEVASRGSAVAGTRNSGRTPRRATPRSASRTVGDSSRRCRRRRELAHGGDHGELQWLSTSDEPLVVLRGIHGRSLGVLSYRGSWQGQGRDRKATQPANPHGDMPSAAGHMGGRPNAPRASAANSWVCCAHSGSAGGFAEGPHSADREARVGTSHHPVRQAATSPDGASRIPPRHARRAKRVRRRRDRADAGVRELQVAAAGVV